MSDRSELWVNPRSDLEFVSLVHELAEATLDAADLEMRLRLTYPAAVVRPRGLSNESAVLWYVYRDGHWVDPAPERSAGERGAP